MILNPHFLFGDKGQIWLLLSNELGPSNSHYMASQPSLWVYEYSVYVYWLCHKCWKPLFPTRPVFIACWVADKLTFPVRYVKDSKVNTLLYYSVHVVVSNLVTGEGK